MGTDTLGGIERASLSGGAGSNTLDASAFTRGTVALRGGAGDDHLIGPREASRWDSHPNRFTGGPGNDTFAGGVGSDAIVESGDTNFTLGATRLTGNGTDTFTSMDIAYLMGGQGDNHLDVAGFTGRLTVLDGRGGHDTLIGRIGGLDRVRARGDADFTLTNSQLTGQGTDSLQHIDQAHLMGYAGANRFDASAFSQGAVIINAGAGNDTLIGGGGNDTLTGGSGADRFRFATAPNASTNRDTIIDFSPARGDTIELENAVFAALPSTGPLGVSAFFIGAAATTSAHRILYNASTGLLSYDSDGNGIVAAITFAKVSAGLRLSSSSFTVT